jgi:hypothetical protein
MSKAISLSRLSIEARRSAISQSARLLQHFADDPDAVPDDDDIHTVRVALELLRIRSIVSRGTYSRVEAGHD